MHIYKGKAERMRNHHPVKMEMKCYFESFKEQESCKESTWSYWHTSKASPKTT